MWYESRAMPAEGATRDPAGAPGHRQEGAVKNRPTGVAVSAEFDQETGWRLTVHRAFEDEQHRVTTYRMSYRGLSSPELVSMIDVELDDLSA